MSTGIEAFSIAMLLAQGAADLDARFDQGPAVLAPGALAAALPEEFVTRDPTVRLKRGDLVAQWFNGWRNGFFNCFQGYWRSC